jgi:hypothetical protein
LRFLLQPWHKKQAATQFASPPTSHNHLEHCPQCGLHFNDWFFWPGIGNYCWPCYHKSGKIYARKEKVENS